MLSCKEVTHLVSQSYDRRLSWAERTRVRVHLWYCLGCRRFARHVEFMRQAIQRLVREQNLMLSPSARERIRRELGANR